MIRRGFADAAPVRAHVERMLALGSDCNVIDRAAGTRKMTAWRLVNLGMPTMREDNAALLLALPVERYASERYRSERVDLPEGIRHGTRGGYQHGCGCAPCLAADKAYAVARGGKDAAATRVPSEPVRLYVERLIAAGCKVAWIARAASVDYCTIYNVREARHATMQRAKADAILAVRSVTFTDWQFVSAASTLALIERLRRQGYSREWMRQRLGHQVPRRDARFVRLWMAREVASLAEFVGDSTPRRVLDRDRIGLMLAAGRPAHEIAETVGCHVRTIERVKVERLGATA